MIIFSSARIQRATQHKNRTIERSLEDFLRTHILCFRPQKLISGEDWEDSGGRLGCHNMSKAESTFSTFQWQIQNYKITLSTNQSVHR